MTGTNNSRKIETADPSALGLFGLAMVTLVASSQKLGITSGVSLVLPWAIFLGASTQLMAGILDAKKMNMFGATAFSAYAFFWYSMGFTWLIQTGALGAELAALADPRQLGFAFVGYLIFTLYMTVGAIKTNRVLLVIFILIDILFLGLSMSSFGIMPNFAHSLAAFAELGIAIMSFYGSGALVINHQFGRTVLKV